MEFRPCIDIHNGKVKQIVGSSLTDDKDFAKENYVSERNAAFYANFYKSLNIRGGHVILLNAPDSAYYEQTKEQAISALHTFPGGLQVGGGITVENAATFLDAGAAQVIVTSYVFQDGAVRMDRLKRLKREIGTKHLVIDLSCRKADDGYYVTTNRWQKMTNVKITPETLEEFSQYCGEFLVHAVDVEGKNQGIDGELLGILSTYNKIPITYAGGVHSLEDIEYIKEIGHGRVNVTIGSALDLFGGDMRLAEVLRACGINEA